MAILVLCLKPVNLLDPNPAFVSFGNRLTISPVVERLVFSKARAPLGPPCSAADVGSAWHRKGQFIMSLGQLRHCSAPSRRELWACMATKAHGMKDGP